MSLGVGVMINRLCGNEESVDAFSKSIGKMIADLRLDDDHLNFKFTDGSGIKIFDDGQSCCESRYMMTDDDLSAFIGSKLIGASIRDGGCQDDDNETHEIEFLVVDTDKGSFTMASHNEHNGYYGGFSIVCRDGEEY